MKSSKHVVFESTFGLDGKSGGFHPLQSGLNERKRGANLANKPHNEFEGVSMNTSFNSEGQSGSGKDVVIVVRHDTEPDVQVAEFLEKRLAEEGHTVELDREQVPSVGWAQKVNEQIQQADAVIPLISSRAMRSEMFGYEVELAHQAAQTQHGSPRIFAVRIVYTGPLPEPLNIILDPLHFILWEAEMDNEKILDEVLDGLRHLPEVEKPVLVDIKKGTRLMPPPGIQPQSQQFANVSAGSSNAARDLEPIGGAVPLDSEFYIERPADEELRKAMERQDSIVLIKGARQIGKTSLLARGLQHARKNECRVALTDLQKFNASNLEDITHFFISLAESVVDQLGLDVLPTNVWEEHRGASVNFERFIRREVLQHLDQPLVWGLDEVDRLFTCSYGSEVFGLFRSWHNERALDPSGPWSRLSLVISYATEAHLFISDMNQSPFNVGTRLTLEDFSTPQVVELNKRYGLPLKSESEINRFMRMVGGHPFLVRRGLHELVTRKMDISEFIAEASKDEGIFHDHLRRILVLLVKDPELTEVVRGVLSGMPCPTSESFYRLRSAGVVKGNSQDDVKPRCELYTKFLSRHLFE